MTQNNIPDLAAEHKTTLNAFSRALTREAHVLTRQPDILWQQMYNRLQWEGELIKQSLNEELNSRMISYARPWAKTRIKFRESQALIRTLNGHNDIVRSCAVSPDGSLLLSAGKDKIIILWDLNTGSEIWRMDCRGDISDCSFSPDGKWILSAEYGGIIKWDLKGKAIFHINHSSVSKCAVSPDGKKIVSSSLGGTIKIWDANTGELLNSLKHKSGSVYSCVVSPDNRWVVSAGYDKKVMIWDLENAKLLHTLKSHKDVVFTCAVSPDSSLVASAGGDNNLKIWDLAKGKLVRTLKSHTDDIVTCTFSPDGKKIVSGSADNSIKIWDTESGKLINSLLGHTLVISDSTFTPNGKRLITASQDQLIKIWDFHKIEVHETIEGHKSFLNNCVVRPDGERFISSSSDKTIKIWDASLGTNISTISNNKSTAVGLAISPDGSWIVSSGNDKNLYIWDLKTLKKKRVLKGHTGVVNACAISLDSQSIVSSSRDGIVKVWSVSTGKEKQSLNSEIDPENISKMSWGREHYYAKACSISPDNLYFAYAHWDRKLKIVGLESGDPRRTFKNDSQLCGIDFSPKGDWIVSSSQDGFLNIWDIKRKIITHSLEGHRDQVMDCSVSPDGAWILSVSLDRTMKIWNKENGQELFNIPLPGPLTCLTLHPWLPLVACGDSGGGFYIIELVGIDYGPIIVTADEGKQGLMLRCPACQQELQVNKERLGKEIICPTIDCGLKLYLNEFTIKHSLE